MLTKPIYEALPLTYLVTGAGSFLTLEQGYGVLAGLLLYSMGSLLWVMRSNFRRKDKNRSPGNKRLITPEWLYEFVPFIYLAMAGFVLSLNAHILLTVLVSLLSFHSMHILYMRHKHRVPVLPGF